MLCRKWFHKIVHHKRFDQFITVAVAVNLFFLAIEYHGAAEWYIRGLELANLVFVCIFALEAAAKILACGFAFYFSVDQN